MFDSETAYQTLVASGDTMEYTHLIRVLKKCEPKDIFTYISGAVELEATQGLNVKSPRQVIADKCGTVIEINELLYQILMSKYHDLILCFYEIESKVGLHYHSQLMYRHDSKNRWVGLERTNQWLTGKLDYVVGTFDWVKENTAACLQSYYNGTVLYRGSGLVSLSGDCNSIQAYVEKVKRFYKPE